MLYNILYILCRDTACVNALIMYSDPGLFVVSDEMKTLWSQAESIFMNFIYCQLCIFKNISFRDKEMVESAESSGVV